MSDKVFSNIDGKEVDRSDTHSVIPKPANRVEEIDIANHEYCRGYADGQKEMFSKMDTLEKELTTLREANRWIPVEKYLPEDVNTIYITVLAFSKTEGRTVAGYNQVTKQWNGYSMRDITHWRPLPSPPENR